MTEEKLIQANTNLVDENKMLKKDIKDLQQEKDNWDKLFNKVIDMLNRSQDIAYLNVLETMQKIKGSDTNE